jgi:transcriptional regulator with XRE-family HTH domain
MVKRQGQYLFDSCNKAIQILQERRESNGLSYRKLAQKTGISNRYLSMIAHGEYHPTLVQLLRIAAALSLQLGPVVSRAQKAWKAQKRPKSSQVEVDPCQRYNAEG